MTPDPRWNVGSTLRDANALPEASTPDYRSLLLRARNVILVELRLQAQGRPVQPTAFLLELDYALGIDDHTWYADPPQ